MLDSPMKWTDPWHPVGPEAQDLVAELQREIGPRHPLAGVQVVPLARRYDQDDVLLELPDGQARYALVHLTWSGRRERDPRWPHTQFFADWDDWIARGMKADDDSE
jgi:hypothetical protein